MLKFGKAASLQRYTDSYNVLSPDDARTTNSFPIIILKVPDGRSSAAFDAIVPIDEGVNLEKFHIFFVVLSGATVPRPSDHIIVGEDAYRLRELTTLNPDGVTPILYRAYLGR